MAARQGEELEQPLLEVRELSLTVRVTYSTPQMSLDQNFSGATADAVVAAMQKEASKRLSFTLRLLVNAMSPTQFAQEVVKRYNESTGSSIPSPGNCLEFIRLGEREGILKVIQP